MNYQYKHLVGAMIVAGWDAVDGPQVYGCPIGGTLSKEAWTTDGSGSTYIWGYLDEEFRCAARGVGRRCSSQESWRGLQAPLQPSR